MINTKNIIIITLIVVFLCCINFTTVKASSVNMNLTQTNTTTNSTNTNTTQDSVSRTNSTVIQSVNSITESSSSGFGVNEILSILLIAIGFVLILLAVAILIRLK